MTVSARGLRHYAALAGSADSDGNSETFYARSIEFTDVADQFTGFLAASSKRYDASISVSGGIEEERGFAQEWHILGKKLSSFDPSNLEGEWAFVEKITGFDESNSTTQVYNEVATGPMTISSGGAVDTAATTNSYLSFGYETPINGTGGAAFSDASLEPGTREGNLIQPSYNADGTFSLSNFESGTAKGLVFPGLDMFAQVSTDTSINEPSNSLLLGVRRGNKSRSETGSMIEDARFRMQGSFTFNDSGLEFTNVRAGTIGFNADGDRATITGLLNNFDLELGSQVGEWRAFSEALTLESFSVSISPGGLIQLEDSIQEGNRVELNGFVSKDGETLILTVAERVTDGSTLGVLIGRCVNCGSS
jgi:hypothetical protein